MRLSLRAILFLAVLGLLVPAVHADTAERTAVWEWQDVSRVVAVGDVHGSYEMYLKPPDEMAHLKAYVARIEARPAFQKGIRD